jgi:PAS domain S-box-containing protein
MPKTPQSPSGTPSVRQHAHSRRPNNSRRSSSDKKEPHASSSSSKRSPRDAPILRLPEISSGPSSGMATTSTGDEVSATGDTQTGHRASDTVPEEGGSPKKSSQPAERNGKERPPLQGKGGKNSSEELERLREAMDFQLRLTQKREKLVKSDLERGEKSGEKAGGKSRVSPIHEEMTNSPSLEAAFASPMDATTSSTESVKTVRGETPAPSATRTPSYPFPPMKTPGFLGGHKPFTTLLPTVVPGRDLGGSYMDTREQILSGSATPSSISNFQPPEENYQKEDINFPNPNLYDLSLLLSAEPGLDPWWNSVVEIMRDLYKADRVTLSIPADSTDVENVPWGQKATYNAAQEDAFSLSYLPRGSSLGPSTGGTYNTSNSESVNADEPGSFAMPPAASAPHPGLPSRHSFTTIDDTKGQPQSRTDAAKHEARPNPQLSRSKSYLGGPSSQHPRAGAGNSAQTLRDVQLDLQELEGQQAEEEARRPPSSWESHDTSARETKGRVFPVLQALDFEADSLIDSAGVTRVLERGKVIALTRDFPFIDSNEADLYASKAALRNSKLHESIGDLSSKGRPSPLSRSQSAMNTHKSPWHSGRTAKGQTSGAPKLSGLGLYTQDLGMDPSNLRYEEHEQAPPSPWSQSPAPSPAVRADPNENPFFADAKIDEESFNPTQTPQDYSSTQQLESIGIDRSCSVLHIPLYHVLLSKSVQTFRLDSTIMDSRYAGRGKPSKTDETETTPKSQPAIREKKLPIAILSILSPIIPYPSNFRRSLAHLAPHLATSFSLCRHYTNLENEIAGLSRRRPHNSGFGAVAQNVNRTANERTSGKFSPTEDESFQTSGAGSLTSPSDYSGQSRSVQDSPTGTPLWDPGSAGLFMDRKPSANSPNLFGGGGDGYFGAKSSAKTRPSIGRLDTGSAASVTGARRSSKDYSPPDARQALKALRDEKEASEQAASDQREGIYSAKSRQESDASTEPQMTGTARHVRIEGARDQGGDAGEARDAGKNRPGGSESTMSPRRIALRTATSSQNINRSERQHTQLHSYGADFASTFQSLQPTSTTPNKAAWALGTSPPSRSGSMYGPVDMPPPSDRLKTLMLDTLPAHLFVALPQTGEIVWVNNRYLTFRGQTVTELHQDPWSSIHPDEREDYLKAWTHAIRSGEQFSMQVRIRRFDGNYRWFYTRAVGGRDTRGVIVQWYGSYMDIHDQHIAEVKAARQEEIEASEAKHRLLANLIPQIIFAATEDEGITFANEQWLSYTGQEFDDVLGLGFMDFVHPDDLARCRIPTDTRPTPSSRKSPRAFDAAMPPSPEKVSRTTSDSNVSTATENTVKGMHQALSRTNSSSSESVYELPSADLSELARNGVIKVTTDSNGRLSYTTEIRLRAKSGEYRWHLVRCVEVDNINFGSGAGSWFGACTDINDHKLLETKLKEAMESKGKFLSNMSHEIRTPLIGISGMVSFLQDTVLNEEQLDYTNTIQTSANSLLMIINDILDLSKVDAGMMKLSYEWFHTSSLIEDVNELVSTMAISKHLELNYVVDSDVPPMVKGDRVRIRQVLLNVIGNAIKFTTEGEVFSTCRVYHDNDAFLDENEIMLEYSILDTGRGFTKEEADLIFKPFSQIDGSSTRQHGGSGLGLVISRQLVELHGGHMDGTAVPGKGSTFIFTAKFGLPTEDDHPEPPTTPVMKRTTESQAPSAPEVSSTTQPGPSILSSELTQSPPTITPSADNTATSPQNISWTSSNPSSPSLRTLATHSSGSSGSHSLSQFNQSARTGSQDSTTMKLSPPESRQASTDHSMPSPRSSASSLPLPEHTKLFRPPLYSILVVCPQTHSREATKKHIEMTLPKNIPYQITPVASHEDAQKLLSGDDPIIFTHIVLNLRLPENIIIMMDQIFHTPSMSETSIVILSDPVQRQSVMKNATYHDYDQLAKHGRLNFIYKPVKPSRFAVIFDPDKERDLSTDRNRSSAQHVVASQKQNYLDVEKRLGNKGLKVLLVEDNLVNQKVLLKFLSKVGIHVEKAMDGVECTETVFAKPHDFYSLILVRLIPSQTSHHDPLLCGTRANSLLFTVRSTHAAKGRVPDLSRDPALGAGARILAHADHRAVGERDGGRAGQVRVGWVQQLCDEAR